MFLAAVLYVWFYRKLPRSDCSCGVGMAEQDLHAARRTMPKKFSMLPTGLELTKLTEPVEKPVQMLTLSAESSEGLPPTRDELTVNEDVYTVCFHEQEVSIVLHVIECFAKNNGAAAHHRDRPFRRTPHE